MAAAEALNRLKWKPQKLILVAEDDEDMCCMIALCLEHACGFRCIKVSDGEEAVRMAVRELPDLILMDAHMPKMTGYAACRKLKQMEATKGIPVVFISGKAQEHEIHQGLRLGAVEYIPKPFNFERLAQRLEEILHGVELGVYEEG
jgi:CheY-like chemotaxis protein